MNRESEDVNIAAETNTSENSIDFADEMGKIELEEEESLDKENRPDSLEDFIDDVEKVRKMEQEEERRLDKENNKEIAKLRRKIELEQHQKEEKDANFKRLMHLLEKSQHYANFLEMRVEKSIEKMTEEQKIDFFRRRKNKRKLKTSEASNRVLKKQKLDSSITVTSEDKENQEQMKSDNYLKERKTKFTSMGIKVDINQPTLLEGVCLRDYQLQGFIWLKLLFETGMNGILADEMGLGKTVQVIALLCHLYEKRVPGPFLIVGPLSTLPNWVIEFNRFAPELPVIVYHGPLMQRKSLRDQVTSKTDLMGTKCMPVVLTSYEMPIYDNYLSRFQWKYIIVDEGHRLKNYKSLLSRTLTKFVSVNRLLLTGTPLQNNLTELWSLLHFLLPEIFDSLDAFQAWFHVEEIESSSGDEQLIKQHDKVITTLHEILNPFLLRREKKDVNLRLPSKKEIIVHCPLTDIQHKLYESVVDKTIGNTSFSSKETDLIIPDNPDGTKPKRTSKLRNNMNDATEMPTKMNGMVIVNNGEDQYSINLKMANLPMMLRKIVNHPYLVQKPVLFGTNILRIDNNLITSSGKFIILDGLLLRLKERGHKVLLFSTMTILLDLIEEFATIRKYNYERLDGNCSIDDRKLSINRFNTDNTVFMFLISTRAGGLGINLISADTVIIIDSDWNPQVDLQAQDRCHRIGQTKPVIVYRFVTSGTIDEKIVAKAAAKRKLERIIIQEGKFKNLPGSKEKLGKLGNLEDLKMLLKHTPQNLEIHPNGTILTDEQWEKLLDR